MPSAWKALNCTSMEKKTKIVATLSDRRCDVDFIRRLYKAGMNVARINTAHVTPASAEKVVENVRRVSDKIAIIVDTKGPEIRVTSMEGEWTGGIPVEEGQVLDVRGTADNTPSTPRTIYMNDARLYDDVPVGAMVLIDDGELELEVVGKQDGILKCRVRNGGVIKPRKSVNVPGVKIDLPSITERDRVFIEWAVGANVDFIAHSFVRKRADVQAVYDILRKHNSPIKVISKIENREGIDNIDEILEETYGVMVARGDLGVEIPAEELPVVQRHIVSKCIDSKKPVIIATQMLHSMIENPRPTRAEVSDIANAIYQRVDAVMLSGETAGGEYPVEAVETMARVAVEIEKDIHRQTPFIDTNLVRINNEITAQLARSAVRACVNLPIRAIVIDTMTGRTGRYIAAFRGEKPVYAVCYRKTVMRQLGLSFGIEPMYIEPCEDHSSFLITVLGHLEEEFRLHKEDLIVVIGGDFGAATGASFMEIGRVVQLEHKALLHAKA